jgi:hypothetical protein
VVSGIAAPSYSVLIIGSLLGGIMNGEIMQGLSNGEFTTRDFTLI